MKYAFSREVGDLLTVAAALTEYGLNYEVRCNWDGVGITEDITFVVSAAEEAVEAALARDLTVIYKGLDRFRL